MIMEKKIEENTDHSYFNTEMIGDLLGDQLRQDSNVVPRLEKLEKIAKLCKLKEELKKLKRGDKMSNEIDPKDLNRDGTVTPLESNIYDFFTGVFNTQQQFFQGVIENTQKHSLWTILGSMAFLLAVVIFSVFVK